MITLIEEWIILIEKIIHSSIRIITVSILFKIHYMCAVGFGSLGQTGELFSRYPHFSGRPQQSQQ